MACAPVGAKGNDDDDDDDDNDDDDDDNDDGALKALLYWSQTDNFTRSRPNEQFLLSVQNRNIFAYKTL